MESKESEQKHFEDDFQFYSYSKDLNNHFNKKKNKDSLKFSDTTSSSASNKRLYSRDLKNIMDKLLVIEERKEIRSLIKHDIPKNADLDNDGYGLALKLNQRKNSRFSQYKAPGSLYLRDLIRKYRVSPNRIRNLYDYGFLDSTKHPHINDNNLDNSLILLPKNNIKKLVDQFKNSNHVNLNDEILEKIVSYTKNINHFINVNNEGHLFVQNETNGIKFNDKEYETVNKSNIEKLWSLDEDDEYTSVIGRTKDYCFKIIYDKLENKSILYYSKGLYDLIYKNLNN